MHIVLLSGGSGKRLWPLSNDVRSKQFLEIFPCGDGRESMVQRVYRQIRRALGDVSITIATSLSQVDILTAQLSDMVNLSVEPCRRDTFPAIALVAAFLRHEKHLSIDEEIVVCPIDPYVEDDYFVSLRKLANLVRNGDDNIYLMGIEPTYSSSKYGYILPVSSAAVSKAKAFYEKPTEELAADYIKAGALWNGGVFAFKLGYILNKAHELIEFTDYVDLREKYHNLEKISFDYAVVEKEKNISVMRYGGAWKDLGTWNTLTEAMGTSALGKTIMSDSCANVHVLNELDIPILCIGVKNVVVAASPEGILVTDRKESAHIKSYVEQLEHTAKWKER